MNTEEVQNIIPYPTELIAKLLSVDLYSGGSDVPFTFLNGASLATHIPLFVVAKNGFQDTNRSAGNILIDGQNFILGASFINVTTNIQLFWITQPFVNVKTTGNITFTMLSQADGGAGTTIDLYVYGIKKP